MLCKFADFQGLPGSRSESGSIVNIDCSKLTQVGPIMDTRRVSAFVSGLSLSLWRAGLLLTETDGGKDPREYCISTKRFVLDDEGKLKGLDTVRVEWQMVSGQWKMEEVMGSEKVRLNIDALPVPYR